MECKIREAVLFFSEKQVDKFQQVWSIQRDSMQPALFNLICLVKQGSTSLMAGWHCAFRTGGSVGEET